MSQRRVEIGDHTYHISDEPMPAPELSPQQESEIDEEYLSWLERELSRLSDSDWERMKWVRDAEANPTGEPS